MEQLVHPCNLNKLIVCSYLRSCRNDSDRASRGLSDLATLMLLIEEKRL